MRLAVFDDHRLGIVTGNRIVDVTSALPDHDPTWPWPFLPRLIETFEQHRSRLEDAAVTGTAHDIVDVTLQPPVPAPSKVIAAVANYAKHHGEVGGGAGSIPGEIFLKAPSSLVGSGSTVVLPRVLDREIHHEAELAVVIGRRARNLDPGDAMSCVFGFTGLLDLSARGTGDRSRRKSYDGFTPLGPWVVTADEIPDPQALSITLTINGQVRQRGHTSDMTYRIAELISYASRVMTLQPGDVIATGTPEGVGRIVDGDEVVLEIENVGSLHVRIAAAGPGTPMQDLMPPASAG